jgi:hypothetical protein
MSELKVPSLTKEPEIETVAAGTKVGFKNKTPAFWTVVPVSEELVECKNSYSGEAFQGTIEEFNALMKG